MKEIYTSNHMWKLFENFLVDICRACNNTSDRKHADSILEKYVTEIVMSIVTTFFSSPFSDQSTTLQVRNTNIKQNAHDTPSAVGLDAHLGVSNCNEPVCKALIKDKFLLVEDSCDGISWIKKYLRIFSCTGWFC
ncbi:inositol 1,4,5-trisphosphate receptor type 1-like [Sapajus apella]|uniref:Inositol 1,4,5-trisphosphate receptor type 1-like n=1 Tax=Sapajus apella TaxID=9515 RepID=A0A6J3HGV7_SAPAP|nr:inositol 1,4,5-trisphosphate receptor type 1-like [Sapajus apella]XP_032129316.1 inositol 1,4,5-trisphosphate receptor type 1-like [Sapajus apella]